MTTHSLTIGGSDAGDTQAYILAIGNSGVGYTVAIDGGAAEPYSSPQTIAGGISYSINGHTVVMAAAGLPAGSGNPMQIGLPSGGAMDISILKTNISGVSGVVINDSGAVLMLNGSGNTGNFYSQGAAWTNNGALIAYLGHAIDVSAKGNSAWTNSQGGTVKLTSTSGNIDASGYFTWTNNGVVDISAANGRISLSGIEGWTNRGAVTVTNTSASSFAVYAYVEDYNLAGSWLNDTGASLSITSANGSADISSTANWTNHGQVEVRATNITAGSGFINGGYWTNTGTVSFISSDPGGSIDLFTATSWTNSGRLSVASAGYINGRSREGDWLNNGRASFESSTGDVRISAGDRANGVWTNSGSLSIIAATDIDASAYNGSGAWLNSGSLSLDATSGYALIGSNVPDATATNSGAIQVRDVTRLALGTNNNSQIINYGVIWFDRYATFGYKSGDDFSPYGNYLNILNSFGLVRDNEAYDAILPANPTKADFNYNAVAALRDDHSVTNWLTLGGSKVYKEESAADTMPTNGLAGTRRLYDGKYYWEVATGFYTSPFDSKAEFAALGAETAVFIPSGTAPDYMYLPDSGVLSASFYNIRGEQSAALYKAPVEASLTMTKESAGVLTLTGDNVWYTGVFNLTGGEIVLTHSRSMFGGDANLSAATALSFGGTPYYTAAVNSISFSGDTRINLRTNLDSRAPAGDMLKINGSVAGSSVLSVTDSGAGDGKTPAEGIKLVDIQNFAAPADSFTLLGDKVNAGAYDYVLAQGALGGVDPYSFYLRNTLQMSAPFKTMSNVPTLMLTMTETGMTSLHKRMGDLRQDDFMRGNDLWIRSYGKSVTVADGVTTEMDILGVEIGADRELYLNDDNVLYVGLMAGYMYSGDILSKAEGQKSSGEGYAPSVGVYGTWLNSGGYYADLALRYYWLSYDLTTHDAAGAPLVYQPERGALALSFEAGKAIELTKRFTLTPSLRFSYTCIDGDGTHVQNGYDLIYDDTRSLNLRVGGELSYNGFGALKPYVNFGMRYEFAGKTDVTYQNVIYISDLRGWGYDVGLGFDFSILNAVNLYGEAYYENGRHNEAFGFNLGVRIGF